MFFFSSLLCVEMDDFTLAKSKYVDVVTRFGGEILVSGSDDFTLFLWYPEKDKKQIGMLMNFHFNRSCLMVLIQCSLFYFNLL